MDTQQVFKVGEARASDFPDQRIRLIYSVAYPSEVTVIPFGMLRFNFQLEYSAIVHFSFSPLVLFYLTQQFSVAGATCLPQPAPCHSYLGSNSTAPIGLVG